MDWPVRTAKRLALGRFRLGFDRGEGGPDLALSLRFDRVRTAAYTRELSSGSKGQEGLTPGRDGNLLGGHCVY